MAIKKDEKIVCRPKIIMVEARLTKPIRCKAPKFELSHSSNTTRLSPKPPKRTATPKPAPSKDATADSKK